jgi:hypothetical protein
MRMVAALPMDDRGMGQWSSHLPSGHVVTKNLQPMYSELKEN